MRERRNPWLRWMDRNVGVPLVAMLSARRLARRPVPAAMRRVGVVQTSGIGDTILLSAVTQDLAARGAQVVLFTGSENAGAARLLAGVHRHVPLAITQPWRAIAQIRAERVDALLDGGTWPRINAVLCAATDAHTVGFRSPGQHRHFAHDSTVDHRRDLHEVDNFRALAGTLGVEPRFPPALEPGVAALPAPLRAGPYVIFHAWSGGVLGWRKEWPPESWRALGHHLAARGARVVVTGAPGDVARSAALVAAMGLPGDRVEDATGRLTLRELAAALRHAELVVAVNTGVLHLAAVVGAPTISLEGPTSPERWGPVGPRAHSVRSSLAGCGFVHLGWEADGHRTDCMLGVDVERVAALADAVRAPAPPGGWDGPLAVTAVSA